MYSASLQYDAKLRCCPYQFATFAFTPDDQARTVIKLQLCASRYVDKIQEQHWYYYMEQASYIRTGPPDLCAEHPSISVQAPMEGHCPQITSHG